MDRQYFIEHAVAEANRATAKQQAEREGARLQRVAQAAAKLAAVTGRQVSDLGADGGGDNGDAYGCYLYHGYPFAYARGSADSLSPADWGLWIAGAATGNGQPNLYPYLSQILSPLWGPVTDWASLGLAMAEYSEWLAQEQAGQEAEAERDQERAVEDAVTFGPDDHTRQTLAEALEAAAAYLRQYLTTDPE